MAVQAVSNRGYDQSKAESGDLSLSEGRVAPVSHSQKNSSFHALPPVSEMTSSDEGVVSRVMAGIDTVGSVPAEVSVYSQPVGHSIVTDVVIHQTDRNDGMKKIGNHWEETSLPTPSLPVSDGIGAAGIRVGAYEESRTAAREAYMMFQGMKLNQTA